MDLQELESLRTQSTRVAVRAVLDREIITLKEKLAEHVSL